MTNLENNAHRELTGFLENAYTKVYKFNFLIKDLQQATYYILYSEHIVT